MKFDYTREPSRDILCIDCKSFYASVECVERGLHPLRTMLVVMSGAENAGGLVLAASPLAKSVLGISNVTRSNELPDHKELVIVPPRMRLYMQKNREINQVYKTFVADEDHQVYSVDESFLDVTASLSLFKCQTAYQIAQLIQRTVKEKTGIYTTVGIGDNPLLAKLALDNEAKRNKEFIAEWRYEDVQEKVWTIAPITAFCGIGKRMATRLLCLGVTSVYDLAHANPYWLKDQLGVMGVQLYAHAWGIDRSFLGQKRRKTKEKSFGNSQVLPKDYARPEQVELVLKEIADQVAARLRAAHCQTQCVALFVGYSKGQTDRLGRSGWRKQAKIAPSNTTKVLTEHILRLFRQNYQRCDIRTVGISYSSLVFHEALQLNLFQQPEREMNNQELDHLIDWIRKKYGFRSLIHASSLLDGATALKRTGLMGGHACGTVGIDKW